MKQQIVIIGAGYAGMMTALRLSHTVHKHNNATITLINASDVFVERIRMHQLAANRPPKRRPIQQMLRGTGVNFVQGWVEHINAEEDSLIVQTQQGEQEIRYDRLVYAIGSMSDNNAIPGIDQHAYTLDFESSRQLQAKLPNIANRAGNVIVIGGGLTGIEAATEIAEQYPAIQVALVANSGLGAAYSDAAQKALQKRFAELGIQVREGQLVETITAEGVQLSDDEYLGSDATIWAGGFRVPELAKNGGIAVNGEGQLLMDSNMRSISHPKIYGAGDASAFLDQAGLPEMRLACGTAMPMGAHLADNLAAELQNQPQEPFAFSYVITCLSLGKKHGLAMLTRGDDSPTGRVYAGRLGGFIKNMILRYTVWSMQLERLAAIYQWPSAIKARAVDESILPSTEKVLT